MLKSMRASRSTSLHSGPRGEVSSQSAAYSVTRSRHVAAQRECGSDHGLLWWPHNRMCCIAIVAQEISVLILIRRAFCTFSAAVINAVLDTASDSGDEW